MAGASVIDFTDEDRGTWVETYSGERFYPFDPHPPSVRLRDIAHHLACTCRFAGACDPWYSVAEHSIRVMWRTRERVLAARTSLGPTAGLVEAEVLLEAVLHDAAEAYMGDVIRPLKHTAAFGPVLRAVEAGIDAAIRKRFGMSPGPSFSVIKTADNELLATERRDLMRNGLANKWEWLPPPLPGKIVPMSAREAEVAFVGSVVELLEHLGRAVGEALP